jgi:hypothetical protein
MAWGDLTTARNDGRFATKRHFGQSVSPQAFGDILVARSCVALGSSAPQNRQRMGSPTSLMSLSISSARSHRGATQISKPFTLQKMGGGCPMLILCGDLARGVRSPSLGLPRWLNLKVSDMSGRLGGGIVCRVNRHHFPKMRRVSLVAIAAGPLATVAMIAPRRSRIARRKQLIVGALHQKR